jgi:predicted translation initiation factor SUI1
MARASAKTVLFLCTGNYYRSRFAEILFNSLAGRMGLRWQAMSRGLALERGVNNVGPMAASAIKTLDAMRIRGGDAVTRMPAAVTAEELVQASRIIALQRDEHLPLVEERHPEWAAKIEFWDVEDAPEALAVVEKEVNALIARLLGGGERPNVMPEAAAEPPRTPAPKPLTAKVGRETSGRRGKGVTTVFDLPLDETSLKDLAATLKQRCGTGGTVKDGRIEIQGDQRERIVGELEKLGYKVKRVGG